jgi:hypothetical protein
MRRRCWLAEVIPMFVSPEIDDEVMLDVIGELPEQQRPTAFILALLVTAGGDDD